MTASKSLLTISRDRPLQSTRTLILEGAGYSVSAAMDDDAAVAFVTAPNTQSGADVSFSPRVKQGPAGG